MAAPNPSGASDLPGARGTEGAETAPADPPKGEATKTRRVLLVDDHNALRQALGKILVWDGFDEAHQARSGPEGAERLARLGGSIDVAVVGLVLGGASGIGWIGRMRETEPDVPIVVLTSTSEPGVLERLRGLGVDEVLSTGAPLGRLVGAIRRLAGA